MQSHLRVELQSDGNATVLAVSGELDLASSPALEKELDRVASAEPELVILDLKGLEFMDSTGLSVLVKAHQRARDAGQRFGLVNACPQVERLLMLTGIGERLSVVEAPDELPGGD